MATSILDQVRSEERQKAKEYTDFIRGQVAQCEYDDAYDKGRLYAEAYAPRRLTWFLAGVVAGIITVGIFAQAIVAIVGPIN